MPRRPTLPESPVLPPVSRSLEAKREAAIKALEDAVKQCRKAKYKVVVDSDNIQILLIPLESPRKNLKLGAILEEFHTVEVDDACGGRSGSSCGSMTVPIQDSLTDDYEDI